MGKNKTMSKIIRNSKSKFGYDFVNDEGKIIEITSKTTDGYLKLPEIVNGRKLVSLKALESNDGDYDLSTLSATTRTSTKTSGTTRTTTPKLNWEDFIDEADLETYKAIKARAEAKLQKKHVEDQIEATKKVLEELYGKLNIKVEV